MTPEQTWLFYELAQVRVLKGMQRGLSIAHAKEPQKMHQRLERIISRALGRRGQGINLGQLMRALGGKVRTTIGPDRKPVALGSSQPQPPGVKPITLKKG